MQKGKCLPEEALQIAEELKKKEEEEEEEREVKVKGESERQMHLKAEFQRIARRNKKAFLNEECKERKTMEWESLEIPSRKLEISRENFMQGWA